MRQPETQNPQLGPLPTNIQSCALATSAKGDRQECEKHLQAGEAFPPSQSLSSLSRMSKTVVAISQDIFFRVPVYLQFNMSKNSLCQCVCANCKQNLLNTFLDKRELISIVVPFIIFVMLLRIELSYVLNACQMRKIMLALTEKCISSLQNVAE